MQSSDGGLAVSRVSFSTGKRHQEAAAVWARRRLADHGGRRFVSPDDQDGVLFADGVGMGKTWEALAAAALLLYKDRPERGRRHVLIICPANLVTKWEDELAAGSEFQRALENWARQGRSAAGYRYARRVSDTLSHTLPIRRARDISTKLTRGRFHPPGGTYIISHGLIARLGRGLAALRRERWDVVIVDEAHNAAARKAIEAIEPTVRTRTKLCLSATPFQLEPRQWDKLARHIVKGRQRVLSRPEIRTYIDLVAKVFRDPSAELPAPRFVRAASRTLSKIAARSMARKSQRRYSIITLEGNEKVLPAHLDQLSDVDLKTLLEGLRDGDQLHILGAFAGTYLRERLQLASGVNRTYIATSLRRFLAMGTATTESPRLQALRMWARSRFAADIGLALRTGLPHKTIVFTSWVGQPVKGEASRLRGVLLDAFGHAMKDAKKGHPKWHKWRATGEARLRQRITERGTLAEICTALLRDELAVVLAGAHRSFLGRLGTTVRSHEDAVRKAERDIHETGERYSFEARMLARRRRDAAANVNPWKGSAPLGAVVCYTGGEERSDRDRAATAFRQLGPPWILVTSQVGSEGIDLQTYTHRIVHYDLEWNPARMEQREGRGDRVGRKLESDLHISYCIVPGTYDERMLHQLVARDRWHGVLLGKAAKALADEGDEARIVSQEKLRKMRLQLAPGS